MSAAILKKAQTKLKTIMSQFDPLCVFFDNVAKKPITEINRRTVIEIELKLTQLEAHFKEISELEFEIEENSPVAELPQRIADHAECTDKYHASIVNAKLILAEYNERNARSASPIQNLVQPQSGDRYAKLPRLSIPTFDGKFDKWLTFYDTYVSMVHTDISLTNIHKFHYLRTALSGEAADVIADIETTSDNYPIAWTALQDRFANKEMIIEQHVNEIFNIKFQEQPTAESLREMTDSITKHVRCLKTLGEPTDMWDTLLIKLVVMKLDVTVRKEWETKKRTLTEEKPKFNDLLEFLKEKWEILRAIRDNATSSQRNEVVSGASKKENFRQVKRLGSYVAQKRGCFICGDLNHYVFYCKTLLNAPAYERQKLVQKQKLCFNCLKPGHITSQCMASKCRKCHRNHNTLLHVENVKKFEEGNVAEIDEPLTNTKHEDVHTHHYKTLTSARGILSTAKISVANKDGKLYSCTALIDNGSEVSFITERLAKLLNISRISDSCYISGVNQSKSHSNSAINVIIHSCINTYNTTVKCLILPRVTDTLRGLELQESLIPNHCTLADSDFGYRREIDILLGADVFGEIMLSGVIQLGRNLPTLFNTQLGWVITGSLNKKVSQDNIKSHFTKCSDNMSTLEASIQKLWEVEDIDSSKVAQLSKEEQICEDHFKENTSRNEEGRFVVKLPLKGQASFINSKSIAQKRFMALEKRLSTIPELKQAYVDFMNEYSTLGHMTEVKNEAQDEGNNTADYYLPHHAVVRPESATSKVRVVYDASCKAENNISFNDIQYKGPVVQSELFTILLRFRSHKYVLTGDIAKMYRQVLVHEDQRHLQKILWRENEYESLKIFTLNTVTYGTTSAPFLATRCLKQLAIENSSEYPQESEIIDNDFYVDDLITGCNDISQLMSYKNTIESILRSGGFELRKYRSNSEDIIPGDKLENNQVRFDQEHKTLGVVWHCKDDVLQFNIYKSLKIDNIITKRNMLSALAQVFDPLGLISPIIIRAKLLIQKLWQLKCAWDEPCTIELCDEWHNYVEDIQTLGHIKIPRLVQLSDAKTYELHGFADASERAYGAAIYARSISSDGVAKVQLLVSKSRVAPLKQVSLPRLELTAACLLVKLMKLTATAYKAHKQYFWSDSTITLHWILGESRRWKTYVANRVAEIQQATSTEQWHHVRSEQNPADAVSRGLKALDLQRSQLWWQGPQFLHKSDTEFESFHSDEAQQRAMPEIKTHIAIAQEPSELFKQYSSLNKLVKISAWCYRFRNNTVRNNKFTKSAVLLLSERRDALMKLIKLSQSECFEEDINAYRRNKNTTKNKKLRSLTPFLDENEILRVGGRLKNSEYEFSVKHPILLDAKHNLTRLIAVDAHAKHLHCGPQALLYHMRENYWPIGGKNLVKKIVHNCVTCFKVNPTHAVVPMGELPKARTSKSFPFLECGIDYAGPVTIRDRKGRGFKKIKAYICLFTCFVSKAVHIETVSDLSTETFIAALRRFISRRGKPSVIHSDNGTNFVGAESELTCMYEFLRQNHDEIYEACANDAILWRFSPARSPHFGGLWEAAVKSAKFHLKRTMGNALFTFEELNTIMIQIEGILNSRPLTEMSSDPNDFIPLTPSHLLIGRKATTIPDPELTSCPENRLSQFQRCQQTLQHFWNRWSHEYLHQLQTRPRQRHSSTQCIVEGTLVLVVSENLPPMKWRTARVAEVYPGKDGQVRVCKIIFANGHVSKRAVTNLCPLPIANELD